MKTTVTLDDDVYEAVRYVAKASGRRMGEVLSELARVGLECRFQSSEKPRKRRGFPVFEVTAQARMIPGTRAAEMLNGGGG